MDPPFDSQAVVNAVEAALVDAEPFAMVPMFLEQLPYVDEDTALSLLGRIVTHVHPLTWRFEHEEMKRWPVAAADFAMEQIRALPPGPERIEAMCGVAERLTLDEKREALDRILDGTMPRAHRKHSKPMSNRYLIAGLVRTLPEEWQEEWIQSSAAKTGGIGDLVSERIARRDVGRLTEDALREMWSRVDHAEGSPNYIPIQYIGLAEDLPPDLKAVALKRIRGCDEQSSRLQHLVAFDEELTPAERRELVEVHRLPLEDPSEHTHLERVVKHLPHVNDGLRRRWLEAVLAWDIEYFRQKALVALLPSLTGEDRTRAEQALVASALSEGRFHSLESRWDLVPDEAFAPLIHRLRDDGYGWSRHQAIAHIFEHRDGELVERCLIPLIDSLGSLPKESCLEVVREMTPWLAKLTDSTLPKALCALSVPEALEPANPLYVIDRVWKEEFPELADI